jgi:uncharacterized protein (TIGR03086 family)
MAHEDVLKALDRALAATDAVVAGIQPGQWDDPTPCTELSVRDVLNHLTGGNMRFAAIIRGETGPARDTNVLGDDPLAAYRDGAGQLRSAFAGADVLTTMYHGPFGTVPGVVLCHIRIAEVMVHGWDLARATGQRPEFPEDLAEDALAAAREQLARRPSGPGAPFASEVMVPADAPAIDRLVGFLGRTP